MLYKYKFECTFYHENELLMFPESKDCWKILYTIIMTNSKLSNLSYLDHLLSLADVTY